MHSLYLSHLAEIANGSRHALAINSRICATFCILPVYKQLLALMVHEYMYRYIHAPANVATNTIAIPCAIGAYDPPVSFLGAIHKIFQLELAIATQACMMPG